MAIITSLAGRGVNLPTNQNATSLVPSGVEAGEAEGAADSKHAFHIDPDAHSANGHSEVACLWDVTDSQGR